MAIAIPAWNQTKADTGLRTAFNLTSINILYLASWMVLRIA